MLSKEQKNRLLEFDKTGIFSKKLDYLKSQASGELVGKIGSFQNHLKSHAIIPLGILIKDDEP